MAVSPDGTRVFVTGYSARARTGPGGEFATIGYKTATGARLWARRYHGPAGGTADARSVAISPDGKTVFVTGAILNVQRTDEDYLTIAYQAATGAMRWIARYDSPGSPSDDQAYAVAVSRDGRTVFVTGSTRSPDRPRGDGSTTIAYRAATGTRRWLAHYNGSGGRAVAVSPRGRTVIITGTNGRDYGTVAYRAADGTRLWARHHDGPAGSRDYGGATALAFSPDGSTVFVTGDSHDPGTPHPGVTYATIAYRAADGTQRWAVSDEPLASTGGAEAVAVSPDGRTVFVTGNDYATVAYRAATGARLWASPGWTPTGLAPALSYGPAAAWAATPRPWPSARTAARSSSPGLPLTPPAGTASVSSPRSPSVPPPAPACGSTATKDPAILAALAWWWPSARAGTACTSPGTRSGPSRALLPTASPSSPTAPDPQPPGAPTGPQAPPAARRSGPRGKQGDKGCAGDLRGKHGAPRSEPTPARGRVGGPPNEWPRFHRRRVAEPAVW